MTLSMQSTGEPAEGTLPGVIPQFLEAASRISTAWSLAAFAMVAILALLTFRARASARHNPLLWGGLAAIMVLTLTPTVADTLLRHQVQTADIYRLRVTVVGPDSVPVDHAKVWSSWGGQPKEFSGGWQFDIPRSTIPKTGAMTVFGSLEQAFLRGQSTVALNTDMNPAIILVLRSDTTAEIAGSVVDASRRPIDSARVWVEGHTDEAVFADKEGGFRLRTHGSTGQQVLLHASKSRYSPVAQYHPGGREPAMLVLKLAR
ncbi:MAG: hypothetical protein H7Z74_02830 [Anaerolineae bacterium]|nr:hypothetical protein [Gemmatimonadaceae bacterium]